MKEFFGQREALYYSRKEYMLARLEKEYEILVNKVKFIQGIISENLTINKVKRKVLIRNLITFELKPMSQIVAIMRKFINIGPDANKKEIKVAGDDDGQPEAQSADAATANAEEDLAEGEVSAKEFEYLLSMPMWSVTEERVDQLLKLMQDKKDEHDILEAKTIYELWCTDLDAFTIELDKVWAQEEADRLKHGGVKNEGNKKRRRAPAKKPANAASTVNENLQPKAKVVRKPKK